MDVRIPFAPTPEEKDLGCDLETGLSLLAAGRQGVRSSGHTPLDKAFNQLAASLDAERKESAVSAPFLLPRADSLEPSYVAAMAIQGLSRLRRQLGTSVADHIVVQITNRLKDLLPRARVGRIGRTGLEFAFEASDDAAAEAALLRLEAALERRLFVDGQIFDLEVVIGFAGQATHGDYVADCASDALIDAQTHGRKVQPYREADAQRASEASTLLRDLRDAMAGGSLSLVYQPKFHLQSQTVRSAEALLRWRHPSKGWIAPDVFIALAEETGLIADLTQWVVRQALADQAKIKAAGRSIVVYLNLSGRLLADATFCDWIRETVLQSDASALGLEITETAVIDDPQRALANLQALADAGLKIAIDDYGSGLSSLSYLKQMPAHELKIDKMFISGLTSSHRDPLLVRSTIDLAHALGMEVTAEGVEAAGVLALLRVMGCDHIQGYLVAKPLELAELQAILSDEAFGRSFARPAPPFQFPINSGATG